MSQKTNNPTPAPDAPEDQSPSRRRTKLIKPQIQLRLGGIFAGLTMLCLLIQWLLFSSLLVNEAHQMPVGGDYLLDLVPALLLRSILFSALIALPLTLFASVHSTFAITGPVHRFEEYLRGVIAGKQLGPCKIREGDALGDLCELINRATEPVRRRAVGTDSSKDTEAA